MKFNLNSTNIEYLIKRSQINDFEKKDSNKILNKKKEQGNAILYTGTEQRNTMLSTDSKIILSLVILKKLNIYKKDITKTKIKDFEKKIDLKLINNKYKINIKLRDIINDLKLEIKELELKIEIGTENAMITAFSVAGISTLLSIILRRQIKNIKKQKFIVIPKYIDENFLNIDVSGIFQIDLPHYIYSIVLRKRDDKNERKSNRRTYDYSYEWYRRNDRYKYNCR